MDRGAWRAAVRAVTRNQTRPGDRAELPCRVQLLSGVSVTPRPAPLSMGFSQQEHWNGLSFPPPGDLPDPGVEHASPKSHALQAGSSL